MKKILSSNFKNYYKEDNKNIAIPFDNTNGIVDQIKENLKNTNTILFICSDPNKKYKTIEYSKLLFESLKLSGITFNNYLVLDSINLEKISEYIENADMIFLSGGDTYIQNEYFSKLKLKDKLISYDGLVIGQSAGALNMSEDVFNSPEEMEDSEPIYFKGLGLTDINIEPHFTFNSNEFDEAQKYQRKCIITESYKRNIYGQCDGSHIFIDENNNAIIYGETYILKNGEISLICKNRQSIKIENDKVIRR